MLAATKLSFQTILHKNDTRLGENYKHVNKRLCPNSHLQRETRPHNYSIILYSLLEVRPIWGMLYSIH